MVTAISTQQRYYQYSTTTPSIHSRTTQKPKPKMSLTQTYYLAHTARRKLSKEASRADHDLRILVSHANLLDNLMLELSNAEQEQQRWVDRTAVSDSHNKNRQFTSEEQHIQWADQTTVEYVEESSEDSDSDSDSDYALSDDEDLPSPSSSFSSFSLSSSVYTASTTTLHRNTAPSVIITQQELLASDTEEEGEEDTERLALTRSPSHSPPELLDDLSDDSEEDAAPPSPPQPTYDIFPASGLSSKSNQKTSFIVRETETSPSFTAVTDDYISPHEPGTMIEAY
jgi:hypothetical protein